VTVAYWPVWDQGVEKSLPELPDPFQSFTDKAQASPKQSFADVTPPKVRDSEIEAAANSYTPTTLDTF
jgi:hypothetical protein